MQLIEPMEWLYELLTVSQVYGVGDRCSNNGSTPCRIDADLMSITCDVDNLAVELETTITL